MRKIFANLTIIFFVFSFYTIIGGYVVPNNLEQQIQQEEVTTNENGHPPSLRLFVKANDEPKILIEQEKAGQYLQLFHSILEEIDYSVNFTNLESQIKEMVDEINKKLLANRMQFGDNLWKTVVKFSRQCQQIGVIDDGSMRTHTGNNNERDFAKKLCRLAMFVGLAEFISSEMKQLLKQYASGLIPRACARIARFFRRHTSAASTSAASTSADITAPTRPLIERAWKSQLLVLFAEIKSNEFWFVKIFDFMELAKDLMITTRALINEPLLYIQSPEIKQQLNYLINRENLHKFVETHIEMENECRNE